MDYHNAELLIWLLILLLTCMKYIDLSDASLTINPSQSKEIVSTIIQRAKHDRLDVYSNRLGFYKYAVYRKRKEREFIGIKGSLNTWLINVVKGDFSATRISMGAEGKGIHISAGWMVNEEIFHDQYPRLFASYTTDNFSTVCYTFNAACTGFVKNIAKFFTVPVKKGSTYEGPQTYMHVEITQDRVSKNWLLQLSKESQIATVGYWTAKLFQGLNEGASIVEWGGLVFRSQFSPGPTPMGNGGLPTLGYNKASNIKFIQYTSTRDEVISPAKLEAYQTDHAVYGLSPLLKTSYYGTHFFYGGPGTKAVNDRVSKNWLFQIMKDSQTTTVGHWPSSLFPGLNKGASTVEWGGLIFRSQLSPGPTPMGSGVLLPFGYNRASLIKSIQCRGKHREVGPIILKAYLTDHTVYGLSRLLKNSDYGAHLFYGGQVRRKL